MAASPRRVLVVDDDPIVRMLMDRVLTAEGFTVEVVENAERCLDRLEAGFRGVVVLDIQLPDMDGTELFAEVKTLSPDSPVVFLTSHGTTDLALDSIQEGAYEFLDKAGPPDRLVRTVQGAFDILDEDVDTEGGEGRALLGFTGLVTRSRAMRALVRAMRGAVDTKVPVLVRGEIGTGKQLIARALHERGPRGPGPFVAVNCAAIPESYVEAELFGLHSGAVEGRSGRVEQADGGTLFLDEVADLPLSAQAKLLRLLDEDHFQPVGSSSPLRADVRVIGSTSRNLEQEVEDGRFREDLYYRLAVFTLYLPSLRERTEDVPALVERFTREYADREGRVVTGVDPMAIEVLQSYSFPGNVRELENIVSYAVVSSRTPVLTIADLPPNFLQAVSLERRRGLRRRSAAPVIGVDGSVGPTPDAPPTQTWTEADFPSLAEMEARHIAASLDLCAGNKAKAARLLGISRMTLYRKIKELEL